MFKYDNIVDFVKAVKREHEIDLIESALWKIQFGEVEKIKRQFNCHEGDSHYLATKIFESLQ